MCTCCILVVYVACTLLCTCILHVHKSTSMKSDPNFAAASNSYTLWTEKLVAHTHTHTHTFCGKLQANQYKYHINHSFKHKPAVPSFDHPRTADQAWYWLKHVLCSVQPRIYSTSWLALFQGNAVHIVTLANTIFPSHSKYHSEAIGAWLVKHIFCKSIACKLWALYIKKKSVLFHTRGSSTSYRCLSTVSS